MINNPVTHIIDSISYLNQFKGKTFLIKLGGSILDNDGLIAALCTDLKLLKQSGIQIIIVHGGSKAINQQLAKEKIHSEFVDGLRVTSTAAMDIIEMVLCGQVNPLLVRKLNYIGIPAIGLAGSDCSMLQCHAHSNLHGHVGTVHAVNTAAITPFLLHAMHSAIPVIAPIGVNEYGQAMNINADIAASQLAIALHVDKLIYLTDQDGIYDQSGTLLPELNEQQLKKLIQDGTVHGGMLTKVNAILTALNNQLDHIHILNGTKKHALIEELFTINGVGTLCKTTVDATLEACA